jgi:hypothetical protein
MVVVHGLATIDAAQTDFLPFYGLQDPGTKMAIASTPSSFSKQNKLACHLGFQMQVIWIF